MGESKESKERLGGFGQNLLVVVRQTSLHSRPADPCQTRLRSECDVVFVSSASQALDVMVVISEAPKTQKWPQTLGMSVLPCQSPFSVNIQLHPNNLHFLPTGVTETLSAREQFLCHRHIYPSASPLLIDHNPRLPYNPFP